MKITKTQLRKIIKEELEKVLKEAGDVLTQAQVSYLQQWPACKHVRTQGDLFDCLDPAYAQEVLDQK